MERVKTGRYGKYVGNALTLSDFVVVNLIFAIVMAVNPTAWHGCVRLVGLMVNVAYLPSAFMMRSMRSSRTVPMDRILLSAFQAVGLEAACLVLLLYFLDTPQQPWRIYAELFGGLLVALPAWWAVSRILLKRFRRNGRNYVRVLIVGTGPTALRLYKAMKSDAGFGFRLVGFADYGFAPDFPYPALYAGGISDLRKIITDKAVDQVYYTLSGQDNVAMRTCLEATDATMTQFLYVPQISRYFNRAFAIEAVGGVPVMTSLTTPLKAPWNRIVKRVFDIGVASVALAFTPLVLPPVALAIKLSSPGPIFFRQKRTGYRGRPFTCYKFRTMRLNQDADSRQATENDPRKTKVGDFLRRTSIDELPQFFNVLRGDMSVVGPRPHMLAHTEQYSQLISQYMLRHTIKPGITGWAQVNGYRGQTPELWQMEGRVEYDVWYIEHWSWLLDVKIVLRTIVNALHHDDQAF